jgi:hypothetical protein
MGVFNDDNYCDNRDLLMLGNQKLLYHKYFMTDYHHLSFIRSQIIYKIGTDVMPAFSKNQPKINQSIKHLPIDLRTNIFHFKKQNFHYYHKLGKHFLCFGQSYNHIPGHGGITRKDLLAEISQNWVQKLSGN